MSSPVVDSRVSRFPIMSLREAYNLAPQLDSRDAARQVYPHHRRNHCKFVFACGVLQEIEGAISLAHSSITCPSNPATERNMCYRTYGNPSPHMPCTNLRTNQAVYGGEQELYEAILAVDHDYRPELIVVLTGCLPALTADDVYAIVERAQPRVKAKVFHLPVAGFDYTGNGFWEDVMPLFADLMDPPTRVDREKVNILGNTKYPYCRARTDHPGYMRRQNFLGDGDEMGRLIESMGLRVNVVFTGDSYRRLRRAPEAATNAILCGAGGLPLARAMQQKFGTDYVNLALPLGPVSTAQWVCLLGKATGREAEGERLIQREWQDIAEIWRECEQLVKGKTALVCLGDTSRPFSIGRMCQELGMDVVILGKGLGLKAEAMDTEHWLGTGFNPRYIVLGERSHSSTLRETMEWLGVDEDELVYFALHADLDARGAVFDPANVARVSSIVNFGRHKGFPALGGGVGYQGAKGLCIRMMEAIKAARRKKGWTFMGRLQGKSWDQF